MTEDLFEKGDKIINNNGKEGTVLYVNLHLSVEGEINYCVEYVDGTCDYDIVESKLKPPNGDFVRRVFKKHPEHPQRTLNIPWNFVYE